MALSRRPAARARQLANLRPGDGAEPGNRRAVRHAGYAAIARERLDAKARAVLDALAADAPLRDGVGGLPAADGALVSLLAQAMTRLEDVGAWLSLHGMLDADGAPRPAIGLEGRLRRECADYLDALGMSPRSRARLGLDLARTVDIATAMAAAAAEPDVVLRRAMLARAGLIDAGEAVDG